MAPRTARAPMKARNRMGLLLFPSMTLYKSARRRERTRRRNHPLRPFPHPLAVPKTARSARLCALPAAPDLAAAAAAWLVHLAGERRLSERTIEAYRRDARQFLAFLGELFGAPPGIVDFTDCAPGDLRAFLARRRAEGVDGRSLQR